jgi:hypothetical protein
MGSVSSTNVKSLHYATYDKSKNGLALHLIDTVKLKPVKVTSKAKFSE